jgi:lysozyme
MDITNAITIIKSFEGIMDGDPSTVNLDPYLCPAKVWTIGWGHAIYDVNGKQVKELVNKKLAYSLYPNGITIEEAEILLKDDVRKFTIGVINLVKTPLNNNQICALISLSFNIGIDNFKGSTLLRLINSNNLKDVPFQFSVWRKSNGKVLEGLVKRRAAEAKLWSTL